MKPTPFQKFEQKRRRMFPKKRFDEFDWQKLHVHLLQKLYARHGLDLHLTSLACPEQYDVLLGPDKVGYLRLRGGFFTVEYPDVMGVMILCEYPDGDGFFEHYERFKYMCKALRAIKSVISPP
jgi:hypothetical protein